MYWYRCGYCSPPQSRGRSESARPPPPGAGRPPGDTSPGGGEPARGPSRRSARPSPRAAGRTPAAPGATMAPGARARARRASSAARGRSGERPARARWRVPEAGRERVQRQRPPRFHAAPRPSGPVSPQACAIAMRISAELGMSRCGAPQLVHDVGSSGSSPDATRSAQRVMPFGQVRSPAPPPARRAAPLGQCAVGPDLAPKPYTT